MTVLHVFPSRSWGGAEIQMIEIAQWTQALGVTSKIWCAKDSPIHKEAAQRGLTTITDYLPLRSAFPQLPRVLPVLKREKVDIVHIHWAAGIRLFYGVKWFVNVKLAFYNHMWVTRRKKDFIHKLAYRAVDVMSVSGLRGQRAILEHLPVDEKQMVRIPYGIELRSIPTSELNGNRSLNRAKWNLPESALVFGYFGRIDRQKGVKEFVIATQELLKENENLHILLVGDPTLNEQDAIDYKNEVFALIESSSFKNRIHHFGHQADFHNPMSCCDLVVMPSYMECYSILILHSFALGIPVVSTDSGGTPDLIEAPKRGWVVPPRTTIELAQVLSEISKSPSMIKEKSEECLRYVREYHSHDIVAEKFVKLYEKLSVKSR